MAQGTIKDFEENTRSGTLLMDDGTEVAIEPESLAGSGLLTLRLGQRVRFKLDDSDESGGIARQLRLVTFE